MRLPLSVRIPIEDDVSAGALEADSWTAVEVLEIWQGFMQGKSHPAVRVATRFDRIDCVDIAGRAFEHDRLHKDESVMPEDADEFKRRCIRECFDHPENIRVYAMGGIKGFLAMNGNRIAMIAVDPDCRGQGIAKDLILKWHCNVLLEAGTQADNEPAKALYKSVGMKKTRAYRTFHKWP